LNVLSYSRCSAYFSPFIRGILFFLCHLVNNYSYLQISTEPHLKKTFWAP
jgi:hypothetical protein